MHLLLLVLVAIIVNLLTVLSNASLLIPTRIVQRAATPTNPNAIPGKTVHLEAYIIWRTSSGGLFGGIHMSLDKTPGHRNNQKRDCLATGAVIANQTSCVCTVTNYAVWNYIDCVAALIVDPNNVPKNRLHPEAIVVRWQGKFFFTTRGTTMKVQQPTLLTDCVGSRRACDGLIYREWPRNGYVWQCQDGHLGKIFVPGDDWFPREDVEL